MKLSYEFCRLFLLAAICAGMVSAQVDSSALTGTVLDSSGGALAGALVVATHTTTGTERRTQANRLGEYELADLPIGSWTVVFSAQGFASARYEDVLQTVGQTRTLNVSLTVAGRQEQVTVNAGAVGADYSSAALGEAIEQRAVEDLPLNGRSWSALTLLGPGAIDQGGATQRSIRFTGRGRDEMNITYDGVDATGIVNQAQKAFVRLAIPLGSIAEFRVTTVLPTAEYGDASGAQIAVVSASGGNQLRGSLFEYLRNSAFDARSTFDQTHGPLPFHLNQFGGTLGGAIQKNRTFFFLDHEELHQAQDQTLIGFVPDAALRSQILSQSPALAPLVNAYPAGNGAITTGGVQQSTRVGGNDDTEYAETIRLDRHLSDSTNAYVRFAFDDATTLAPLGTLADRQLNNAKPLNGAAELSHVFSPTAVNEFKFGTNEMVSHTYNLTQVPYTVNVSNLTALNSSQTTNQDGRTFGWVDDFTLVRGQHTFKMGGEIRYIGMNEGHSFGGTLTYSSLAAFQANQINSATYQSLEPLKRMRKTSDFLFFQDQFKIRPNLTLTAGIRWEYYSDFHETTGRDIPFDFQTCGGFCPSGAAFLYPAKLNFDPRAALAWAPTRMHGNTVLRIGYGIYHEDAQLDDQNFPTTNDVPSYTLTGSQFPGLSYPFDSLLPTATGVLSPKDQVRRRKDTYAQQWSLSIQQNLPDQVIGTIAYVGNKGTDIMNRSYTNVISPLLGVRPYPQFGQIELRAKDGNSEFQAFEASARRFLARGWLLTSTFMWSHALNDGSLGSGVEDDFPEDVGCRRCERASSDQDARLSFSASTVYELRYRGPLRAVFGGWELAGIAGARSALPVNVTVDRTAAVMPDGNSGNQRPNAVLGVPGVPPGGPTPALWINPAAFSVPAAGTWGNLGKNAVRGPALWQIDTALQRSISLRERAALQVRAECFNIFNRAQYGNPAADISAPSSFGRITTLVNTSPTGSGTPRQFELAMKLAF